jgi:hypothetical protein
MTDLKRIQPRARELAHQVSFRDGVQLPSSYDSRRATITVQPFRMNLIASAESLGHQRMRLHKRPEPRALCLALTQLSRSGRRKTTRGRRDVQHAGPIACRIVQRRNHGISELPV